MYVLHADTNQAEERVVDGAVHDFHGGSRKK